MKPNIKLGFRHLLSRAGMPDGFLHRKSHVPSLGTVLGGVNQTKPSFAWEFAVAMGVLGPA